MAEEARRLGRGLAALIGTGAEDTIVPQRAANAGQRKAPVEFLRPNAHNPRKDFGEEDLTDLANSIREKGVLQPIVVRAFAGLKDAFEIIAGERRWRAAQKAGLHEVPIVVVTASDKEALELAIIENVQRADLNPLEEATGYERLVAEYGYTQADLAKTIGKSRSHVANMMRLTKLPAQTKAFLSDGRISAGHARALLAVSDPDATARMIVAQGLTVRDVEQIAQRQNEPDEKQSASAPAGAKAQKDADTRALEKRLADALGLVALIKGKGEKGELVLKYKTLDQLDLLCGKLGVATR
ncbi:MAG: ParB/RepB/Spo0J family partition protein [Hyphomicrobiales bacterium]|nr:ParB/RepB/Spo0J family partition protein [Hyphomicrobiales bacterium]